MKTNDYDRIDWRGRISVIGAEGAMCYLYAEPQTKELFIFSEEELIEYAGKNRLRQRRIFSKTHQTEIRDKKIKIPKSLLERANLSLGDKLIPSYSSHYWSLEKFVN